MTDQFETFWKAYPRKLAKGAARIEFVKALRKTTLDEIMAGIERYKANKPEYCDYCHPRTWLHQERWADEWLDEQPERVRPVRDRSEAIAYCRERGWTYSLRLAEQGNDSQLPKMVPESWTAKLVAIKGAA